jgi:hypothetical protein
MRGDFKSVRRGLDSRKIVDQDFDLCLNSYNSHMEIERFNTPSASQVISVIHWLNRGSH